MSCEEEKELISAVTEARSLASLTKGLFKQLGEGDGLSAGSLALFLTP